jgi:glycosyltransferase involved in cell wall biosynthesis
VESDYSSNNAKTKTQIMSVERKVSLGVVAISYNEERDLPGFLANLTPWVDEIVIVDDGSTDRTAEIARGHPKLNFLVSPRNKGEYYAQQRNKGIDAAKSEWLLHMDIDERVAPQLAHEILTAIQENQFDCFKYRRNNYFLHRPMKGGGWADWNLVHLAKKEVFRFSGMYHETIELAPGAKVGQLKEKMIHFNDESYSERLRKSLNYQQEAAQYIRSTGKRISALQLIWSFLREFLVKYFYKKGFKDKTAGLLSAMHSASAAYKANAIVWDEQHKITRSTLEKNIQQAWEKKQ